MVDTRQKGGPDIEIWGLLRGLADSAQSLLGVESDLRFRLLRRVGDSGRRGLSQIEAANALGVSGSTLSRLCDNLEMNDLLERVAHPNDRRVRTLHLTPKGIGQLSLCSGALARNRGAAVGDLSPQEIETLTQLLARIAPPSHRFRKCDGCGLDTCMAAGGAA